MTLSQVYDGDRYLKDGVCVMLRGVVMIPHPLRGVQYADGFHHTSRANTLPGVPA